MRLHKLQPLTMIDTRNKLNLMLNVVHIVFAFVGAVIAIPYTNFSLSLKLVNTSLEILNGKLELPSEL